MKRAIATAILGFVALGARAQGVSGGAGGLHQVLDSLYADMVPLASELIGAGRAIAGFAALFYIASRVWGHIARAEAVDFYPLLRPFALGMAIMLFPSVLHLMNAVLSPLANETGRMVEGSNAAVDRLLEAKQRALESTEYWEMYVGESGSGNREGWYEYTHPEGSEEGFWEGLGNDIKFAMEKASFNFSNSIKKWMSEVLEVLYHAAALCINTIRVFYLIILSVLGPIVMGISVFDGFGHSLRSWIARYINVYMWLPVANIFGAIIGKIQENMLLIDIGQVENQGKTFFSSTDTAYLIFLVIAIIGYFTVPSVANYIVHAAGGDTLLHKTSRMVTSAPTTAAKILT
ncbi:conjugative transposon protein TraJ [Echinicola vietnamensis]|uniref:Conjugative transposon TraJ protein n=1 Tax=Echinicola vietnamensis (strain DSM 17526 / LMG 23754 / KMM 6221) TaxID=926556 RepID=L0G5H6_ECHVK|nr:conjugative transposon protein TraJ [Echinicola vietnamensis]AGA80543.1 conjugative transposon TraJ protein [Echinicola vietnamensis DSM 17526]